MTSLPSSSAPLGSAPLTPPPGVRLDTPEKEQTYRSALEFERFFVQQMLKPMQQAGSMIGGDEGGGSGATAGYSDMAQDQLTQAVLDGGGLGLASTLYGQMAQAAGLDEAATTAAQTTSTTTTTTTTGAAAAAGGEGAS